MAPLHITGIDGSSVSEGIKHWVHFDLVEALQWFPTLIIGQVRSKTMGGDVESSIKLPATVLIGLILAIIAGNWVIFMLYMDSKWDGVNNNIQYVQQAVSDKFTSVDNAVTRNGVTILSLQNRVRNVELEQAKKTP